MKKLVLTSVDKITDEGIKALGKGCPQLFHLDVNSTASLTGFFQLEFFFSS